MPMRIKVGKNVGASHDLQVVAFMHDGIEHMGLSCSAQTAP
jgi:hypothetical protein